MTDRPLNIEPLVPREALAEQIVRQIADLIKRGELKPGDRLPAERVLAAKFRVGRPTLREALRALKLLDVLDIRHGGGVFVSELQPDTLLGPLHSFLALDRHDIATVLEARRVIEGAILSFVAPRVDAAMIGKLEANLERFAACVDAAAGEVDMAVINELAEEFRDIIESAVDNPILTRAVTSLDILSTAMRYRIAESGSLERLLDNHRRIVDALRTRDPGAARAALEAHLDYLSELCDVQPRRE